MLTVCAPIELSNVRSVWNCCNTNGLKLPAYTHATNVRGHFEVTDELSMKGWESMLNNDKKFITGPPS